MGELTAIDRVEVFAGSSIMLGVCFVGLTVMKRGFTTPDVVRAGAVLMTLSLLATSIYVSGLIAVAYGWTTPSLFSGRYRENLIGSLIVALIGLLINCMPAVMARIAARRDRS